MAANICTPVFIPKFIQFLSRWGNNLDLLTNTPLVDGVLSFHSSMLFSDLSGNKAHVIFHLELSRGNEHGK